MAKKNYGVSEEYLKIIEVDNKPIEAAKTMENADASKADAAGIRKLRSWLVERYQTLKAGHTEAIGNAIVTDDLGYEAKTDIVVNDRPYFNVPLEKGVIDILDGELGDRDVVYKLEPVGTKADVNKIRPNRIVMDHLYKEDGTSEKTKEFRRHFLKYGIGVIREGVMSKKKKIRGNRNEKFDGNFLTGPTDIVKMVTETSLKSRVVHPSNFYIDTGVTDFNNANDCFESRKLSKEDVISIFNGPSYFNVETMLNGLRDVGNDVLHYYNVNEDMYSILVNRTLIYNGPNPYPHKRLPYSVALMRKHDDHPYGRGGIVKMLRFAKPYLNRIFNITLDRAKNSNRSPLIVGNGAEFDGRGAYFDTGAIWKITGSVQDVKELKVSPPDSSIFNVVEVIFDLIVRVIGVDPRSIYTKSTKTKFEAGLIEESKNKRIARYGKSLDYAYARFLNRRLKNAHYFLPVIAIEDIVDPGITKKKKLGYNKIVLKDMDVKKNKDGSMEFDKVPGAYSDFELTPEAIAGDFAVSVVTESTRPMLKEIAKEDIMKVLGRLGRIARFNPNALRNVDFNGLVRKMFMDYGLDRDDVLIDTKSTRIEKRIEREKRKMMEGMRRMRGIIDSRSRQAPVPAAPAPEGGGIAPEEMPIAPDMRPIAP